MARHTTTVLPFRVNLNVADSLLQRRKEAPEKPPPPAPGLLDQWEVLLLHFTHEWLRLQRLAPSMSPQQILAMQGERCLLARQLDAIEAAIKLRVEREAKAVGLIA